MKRTLLMAGAVLWGCAGTEAPQDLPGSGSWGVLQRGDEKIDVYRDRWGIPHVFAGTVEGAFWAQGYVQAEDRFEQMEQFRRGARGETAKVAGEKALAADTDRRMRGYTAPELRSMFQGGKERFRRILEAHAEGVYA